MAQRAVEMAHQAAKVLQAPSQVNEILVTAQTVRRMQTKQLVSLKPNQLCSNVHSSEYLCLMEFVNFSPDDESKNQKETSSSSSLVSLLYAFGISNDQHVY